MIGYIWSAASRYGVTFQHVTKACTVPVLCSLNIRIYKSSACAPDIGSQARPLMKPQGWELNRDTHLMSQARLWPVTSV